MSCASGIKKFRLLDAYVGWDPSSVEGLIGVDDPAGLRLAAIDPGAVDPSQVDPFIPPALLTPGCDPCTWYFGARSKSSDKLGRLLQLNHCSWGWEEFHSCGCTSPVFGRIVGVAFLKHRLAVADIFRGQQSTGGQKRTRVFRVGDGRILAEMPAAGPLAFRQSGELWIGGKEQILRFTAEGAPVGKIELNTGLTVNRMAEGSDCRIWVLVETASGSYQILVIGSDGIPVPTTLDELAQAFPRTHLAVTSPEGFCFDWPVSEGLPTRCCYDWHGGCLPGDAIVPTAGPALERYGQLLTLPLDSEVEGCRWHRIRVDADVPAGTSVSVVISTSADIINPAQGAPWPEPEWAPFQAGAPFLSDWQAASEGSLDYLVRQPAGRYVYCRIRLTGDGVRTPVVRRVRLDFERVTSLDYLPAVYRETPEAEDFTERFLSIYDALLEHLDSVIEAAPALLDSGDVPSEALPWIASFYSLVFERDWTEQQRRRLLKALPRLYRQRGTPQGLIGAICEIFGLEANELAIQELPFERAWGGLNGNFNLGQSRLFSRAKARFRLASSPLGQAPLKNLGNPALDAHGTHAHRFRVQTAPVGEYGPVEPDALTKLVEAQKPAHTWMTSVDSGGGAFVLGTAVVLGADTILGAPEPPALGRGGNVRLSRQTVLWPSSKGSRQGFTVGDALCAGENTRLN